MSYLSLKIFKQDQFVKTKIFTDDQISIGSSEGLSLQLDGISPWHILIERKHDIFCILDLNSETGTFLNGQKVADETPISSGSLITAGPYTIQFFVGPPVENKAQAPVETKSDAETVAPVVPSLQEKKERPERTFSQTQQPASSSVEEITPQTQVPSSSVKENISQAPPVDGEASPSVPSEPQPVVKEGSFAVKRPSKPSQKGFWNTYAPLSKIQNLDEFLEPSIGNLIEVIVCWKERILRTYHFFEGEDIFMGNKKDCRIRVPNMLGQSSYKLLSIASGAKVFLSHGIQGLLFQGREKSTRTFHKLTGNQTVVLKPYEMVKLEFPHSLRIYVRLMNKPQKVPFAGLLNLKLSEAMALFLAFLLTGLLVFYGSLYAPVFLAGDTKFIEKDVRVAKVVFKKPPASTKIVEYEMGEKTRRAEIKKKPRVVKKKPSVKVVKKPRKKPKVKKISTPRKTKPGKMAAQAPGKKVKKKKLTVGSVRPGGSLKTGKKGSSAKTVAPDPNKVGLLGVFGGGGKLSKLDKGASGSGGLLGLAEQSTGFAGTEEAYEGEGIGTKTKDLGAGGQGSALVGISGIKTRGKGLGSLGSGTGGLGQRGRMNIEFGTEDIDVTGEIDREAILRVLRVNRAKFNRCYQLGLIEKPSIQGGLGMQWLISSNGRGRRAKAISDPMGSKSLANCVAGVLERLNFPSPPSGQTPKVTFTFRFSL